MHTDDVMTSIDDVKEVLDGLYRYNVSILERGKDMFRGLASQLSIPGAADVASTDSGGYDLVVVPVNGRTIPMREFFSHPLVKQLISSLLGLGLSALAIYWLKQYMDPTNNDKSSSKKKVMTALLSFMHNTMPLLITL